MKKFIFSGTLFLILLLFLAGCGGGSGESAGGNGGGGGNNGGNDGEQPISYENYSFEYLYNDGSGYQVSYTYASNGLKSLQQFPDGIGIYLELDTGITIYFSLKDGTASKFTDSSKINYNILTSLGVIGSGAIGERIGGETLDNNFCDIVKITGNSSTTFFKIWYCKKWNIALKIEEYANDNFKSGFYLKKFQLGNCSDDMVKLPDGLDILDLDALNNH